VKARPQWAQRGRRFMMTPFRQGFRQDENLGENSGKSPSAQAPRKQHEPREPHEPHKLWRR
jgi:hypothetical protein